jgi:hypothetical protein
MRALAKTVVSRLPLVVAARKTGSLARDAELGACVRSKTILYPEETLSARHALSEPVVLSGTMPERVLWRLAGVCVWPAFGAVTYRGTILEDLLPEWRLAALLAQQPMFWRYPSTHLDGCVATYTDTHSGGFYHWLIDDLPRLYGLHSAEAQRTPRILLLRPPGGTAPFERATEAILAALLPSNVTVVPAPAQRSVHVVDHLSLPRLSGKASAYLPRDYLEFFRQRVFRALEIPPPSHRRRVYVSRRLAPKRRLTNEAELVAALGALGFEEHCLETYSLRDQIALMREAECVVGAHGAGLANLIFATDSKLVEIHAAAPRHHLRWLCHALGHDYADVQADQAHKNADAHAPIERILGLVHELGLRPRKG